MSLISRLAFCVLIITLSFPLTIATSVTSRACKKSEFWYEAKNSCLPHGGPSSVPEPPKGQECPPTGYYWGRRQGCCVPKHPPPGGGPPPQCRKGWQWYPYLHMCLPSSPTPPSPPQPHPSAIHVPHGHDHDGPSHGYKNHGVPSYSSGQTGHQHGQIGHQRSRRSLQKSRSPPLCPGGLDACPIAGHDYECVDTATELRSCGGCPSLGQGQDCTAIPGAFNVGCELGSCSIYTCSSGFRRSADGKSCIPL